MHSVHNFTHKQMHILLVAISNCIRLGPTPQSTGLLVQGLVFNMCNAPPSNRYGRHSSRKWFFYKMQKVKVFLDKADIQFY